MALTKIDDRGVTYPLDLLDGEKIRFGTGNDIEIYHESGQSYITNSTGNFRIDADHLRLRSKTGTEAFISASVNGAVELFYDNAKTFETTTNGVIVTGTEAGDAFVYMYADEGDDNADKYRLSSITNGNWEVQNYSSGSAWETNIRATGGGAVSLYYDDAKKFETQTNGITVTGLISASGNLLLNAADDQKLYLGASNDLQIYHDGSNSYITNGSDGGTLYIQTYGENSAKFFPNGAVELYYDGVKKLETASDKINFHAHAKVNADNTYDLGASGARWKDLFISNDIDISDNGKILLGDGDDLQIYHQTSDDSAVIKNTNDTGFLRILSGDSDSSGILLKNRDDDVTYLRAKNEDGVELYYDNTKRFETISAGATVTGSLGIGTTSPAVTLEVEKTIDVNWSAANSIIVANNLLRLENPSTNNSAFAGMQFRTGDGGDAFFGSYQHNSNANDCTFYWSNQTDGGAKTMARLDSETGDLTIEDGDLVIGTSGHGIDFSATSDASGKDNELLDDYEEGTWTAVFKYYNNGGWQNVTYSTNPDNLTGWYTKIGNVVRVTMYTGAMAIANGHGYQAQITGLPYTTSNTSYNLSVGTFGHTNCFSDPTLTGYTQGGEAAFRPTQVTNGTSSSNWQNGTKYMIFSLTYFIA